MHAGRRPVGHGADVAADGSRQASMRGLFGMRWSAVCQQLVLGQRQRLGQAGQHQRVAGAPAAARRRRVRTCPAARRTDTTRTPTACSARSAERAADAGGGRRQRDAEQPRLLQLVDGVVVGAVEVAAQQAVARVALRPARCGSRAASARPPAPARGWPASASLRSPRARPRWRRRRCSRSRSVSSSVRTITGTCGACARTRLQDLQRRRRVRGS